jgi:nucleoside-diphosphate-sugar epimerase
VHGHVLGESADESAPAAPEDYYQYTKWEGEQIIPQFVNQGLKVVTLRPTAIYGPGDPERFYHLIKMVKTGRFLMFGNGASHYHPVFIDNLVDAFEAAAASNHGRGEAYLIGDEHYVSLNELVLSIANVLGIKRLRIQHVPFWPLWMTAAACEVIFKPLPMEPPLFRRRVDWFRQNRAFNITKAKKELGYQPRVGLTEGLTETVKWYKEHGYL